MEEAGGESADKQLADEEGGKEEVELGFGEEVSVGESEED